MTGRTRRDRSRRWLIVVAALAACGAPDPLLSFLDDESGLAFTHPPRWSVGFAEQDGVRYRYLTAPKVGDDAEALSVTLLSPTAAGSPDEAAEPYLAGASGIRKEPASPAGSNEWSFRDPQGVLSRLRTKAARDGRYFGAWARGSDAAMELYARRLDALFASLSFESPADWPLESFAGMVLRAPATWSRGSRLSNATHATMQFKSLPLAVDKETETIHGFVTLSKEPVPPPGDLDAFYRHLRERASDTVVVVAHEPWAPPGAPPGFSGYADQMRSGTSLSATRSRRWITVENRVGLVLACEARADAFDRLAPWCVRMADTLRLE